MKKFILLTIITILSMLFACSGGGHNGGKNGGSSGRTVRLSLDVVTEGDSLNSREINATGTNPLPDAIYYYKATPRWNPGAGVSISGATDGFVKFDPSSFSDDFSLGQWSFEVEVRAASENHVILFKTPSTAVPVTVNASTVVITVNVDKEQEGTGYATVDIYAPTLAADEAVTFYYGKIGGTETSVELTGEKILDGEHAGYTYFRYLNPSTDNRLNLSAGWYLFRAIYSYTYEDGNGGMETVPIENGDSAICEVYGDGSVAITGSIEGNSSTLCTLTVSGIHVMGLNVKAVVSESDDTEVKGDYITAGERRVYKATPKTGTVDGSSITYIEPDAYQWNVNGEDVPGANGPYFILDSSDAGVNSPGVNYVKCRVWHINDNGIVDYAADAGKVLVVRPDE